jgi:hypothetical protein
VLAEGAVEEVEVVLAVHATDAAGSRAVPVDPERRHAAADVAVVDEVGAAGVTEAEYIPEVVSVWRVIPWATILKQAPMILAAADALLANSRRQPPPPSSDDQSLRQRLEQIEQLQRNNADVVVQLADQVNALTAAAEADAARTRLALACGIAGVALGATAILIAWLV